MEQDEFYEILDKYRSGKASEEERKIIDEWYEALDKQPDILLTREKERELEKRFWLPVIQHVGGGQSGKTILLWTSIGVAASFIIATLVFIYAWKGEQSGTEKLVTAEERPWVEITNVENAAQRFTLPDGTYVTIEPKSTIKLSPLFNRSNREVRLLGQAFFDVAHDEKKPFLVYANEITAKVLGTRFTIKALKGDKNVSVEVESGRVSVYTSGKLSQTLQEIILTPNQGVVYNKSSREISRTIAEMPQPILPPAEVARMRFEEASIKEILEAIEKVYGVDIEFDEAVFASCTVTTAISDGNLYNRLNMITSAIGAKYELVENKIVVTGTGCN
jgi:transmembrane sensor